MLYGKLLILWLCYGCAIYYECVLYMERRHSWIFVDWIVMKFYHRSSKSFLSLQSSCLVQMFQALFTEHVAVSPSLCFSVVLCAFPNGSWGLVGVRICSDEAEPSHVAGAHLDLSCFIEAVRLMDIRKDYLRSTTITTTTITISSVLQPGLHFSVIIFLFKIFLLFISREFHSSDINLHFSYCLRNVLIKVILSTNPGTRSRPSFHLTCFPLSFSSVISEPLFNPSGTAHIRPILIKPVN